MALSPWKRLTRLMLRRRPADQVQAQLSDNRDVSAEVIDTPDAAFANLEVGDAAAAELVPTGAVADELSQLPDAEPAEAAETAAELEAASEPLDEDKPPTADEVPPADPPVQPLNEDQANKPHKTRRNTAKAAPPFQAAQDQVRTPDTARLSSSDPRALEREIRQLRAQLSLKLRIQNAQLKQMLRRFEHK
jgi:hypothetical protein